VTDDQRPSIVQRRQQKQQQDLAERRAREMGIARDLEKKTDAELIGSAPGFPGPHHEMEMQRRLKTSVAVLTAEIVAFRKASDAAARKVSRLTQVLVGATAVLVILTGVLVWLTAVLATRS
jgi:hypothetical protein